jgi:hypothetical protein
MDVDVPPGAMPANEREAANAEAREKEGEKTDAAIPACTRTPDALGTTSEPADPFRGIEVLSPLRRRTVASVEDPSDPMQLWTAVNQLRRLSTSELLRENNIARNKELLATLGLDKTFNEKMGMEKKGPAAKRVRSGGPAGRKAKRSKGQDEEVSGASKEDEDNEEEEDEPTPALRARTQRVKPAVRRAAPKEWVVKAKKALEQDDMGPEWVELVREWYRREEDKGFVSPVSVCLTSVHACFHSILTSALHLFR